MLKGRASIPMDKASLLAGSLTDGQPQHWQAASRLDRASILIGSLSTRQSLTIYQQRLNTDREILNTDRQSLMEDGQHSILMALMLAGIAPLKDSLSTGQSLNTDRQSPSADGKNLNIDRQSLMVDGQHLTLKALMLAGIAPLKDSLNTGQSLNTDKQILSADVKNLNIDRHSLMVNGSTQY